MGWEEEEAAARQAEEDRRAADAAAAAQQAEWDRQRQAWKDQQGWDYDVAEGLGDFFGGVGDGLTSAFEDLTGQTAARERERAARERQSALGQWQSLDGPMDRAARETQRLAREVPDEGFVWGEKEAQAFGAQADADAVRHQRMALDAMSDVYQQGGMTALDRARYAEQQGNQRTYERGQREAALQAMESRGALGGGNELLARLVAQQEGANRLSSAGLGIEAMAQQRGMDAMRAAGAMAGDMRGQSFSEDMARRQAQDEINRFNTTYAREHSQRRAGRQQDSLDAQRQNVWQSYGARERQAAGATNQYEGASSDAAANAQAAQRRQSEMVGGLATALSNWTGVDDDDDD